MNWYKIDYARLVMFLIPPAIRSNSLFALLYSLVVPLQGIAALFKVFREDVDYKLKHNSQVCFLTGMLNDAFDPLYRRIYIQDAWVNDWSDFLWVESEDKPVMLETVLISREQFIGSNSIDFVVFIPESLNMTAQDMDRMNALLRYYKLAGKRYDTEIDSR